MSGVAERDTASAVIAHPVRVQILTIANERDISPARYVEDILGIKSRGRTLDAYSRALSHVAYHFRVLARVGCLEVVDEPHRRGSIEHVYRSVARAEFTDDEWAALTAEERCELITVTWQGLMAKTEAARLAAFAQVDQVGLGADPVAVWAARRRAPSSPASAGTELAAVSREMQKVL